MRHSRKYNQEEEEEEEDLGWGLSSSIKDGDPYEKMIGKMSLKRDSSRNDDQEKGQIRKSEGMDYGERQRRTNEGKKLREQMDTPFNEQGLGAGIFGDLINDRSSHHSRIDENPGYGFSPERRSSIPIDIMDILAGPQQLAHKISNEPHHNFSKKPVIVVKEEKPLSRSHLSLDSGEEDLYAGQGDQGRESRMLEAQYELVDFRKSTQSYMEQLKRQRELEGNDEAEEDEDDAGVSGPGAQKFQDWYRNLGRNSEVARESERSVSDKKRKEDYRRDMRGERDEEDYNGRTEYNSEEEERRGGRNPRNNFEENAERIEEDNDELNRNKDIEGTGIMGGLEDKPIMRTGKTFEQLLEEQLENQEIAFGKPRASPGVVSSRNKQFEFKNGDSDELEGNSKKHQYLKKNSRGFTPTRTREPHKAIKKNTNETKNGRSQERSFEREEPSIKFSRGDSVDREYNPSDYLRTTDRDESSEKHNQLKKASNRESSFNYHNPIPEDRESQILQSKVVIYDDQEDWHTQNPSKQSVVDTTPQDPHANDPRKKSSILDSYFKEKPNPKKKTQNPKPETPSEEEIVKKYVANKIEDLETETRRLRDDRERMKVKENRLNEELKAVQKERETFAKHMKEEAAIFEEKKEEELKKIRKEKKAADGRQKATAGLPNRKEREEIEALKERMRRQEEEHKEKEKKSKLLADRQKKTNEELMKRVKELEDQVHFYEQLRLEKTTASVKGKTGAISQVEKPGKAERSSRIGNITSEEKDRKTVKVKQPENVFKKDNGVRESIKPVDKKRIESSDDDEELQNFKTLEKEIKFRETIRQEEEKGNGFIEANENEKWSDEGSGGELQEDTFAKFQDTADLDQYLYTANVYYQEYKKSIPTRILLITTGRLMQISEKQVEREKTKIVYEDGSLEWRFPDGRRREIFTNEYIVDSFPSGDVKQTLPDGTVIYYYANVGTTKITFADTGLQIFNFNNGQVEFHYEDGSKQIK